MFPPHANGAQEIRSRLETLASGKARQPSSDVIRCITDFPGGNLAGMDAEQAAFNLLVNAGIDADAVRRDPAKWSLVVAQAVDCLEWLGREAVLGLTD